MKDIDNAISQLQINRPDNIPVRLITDDEKVTFHIDRIKSYRKEKFRRALKSHSQTRVYDFYKTIVEKLYYIYF